MNRPRRIATVVHRYTGLAIALFVAITGLTGAIIAWNDQLERVFAPALFVLPGGEPRGVLLDPLTLRDAAARESGFAVNEVDWPRPAGAPAFFPLTARPGGPAPHDDEIALDPATGRIVGARRRGDLTQGTVNLLPFIYDLHDQLALGDTGTLILGIVALLWTIDCFVGAYLTFPARSVRARPAPAWLVRWTPAWLIRRRVGRFKLFYDLHRAGGLWPWALMLIIAWSSVSFNLPQVYRPVMAALLGTEPDNPPARVASPARPPRLDWRAAHAKGQALMTAAARREGFVVRSERLMFYDPGSHAYTYRVLTDRDPATMGMTQVRLDGDSGRQLALSLPTGRAAGTTLTTWIGDIHTGGVLGIPLRIALSLTGLGVTSLSGTGVWLWWRKRRARQMAAIRLRTSRSS